MSPPLFELSEVSMSFQGRPALEVESLCFDQGMITAIQGHNGSGKTTLLRILAGLLSPDRGRVNFLGRPLGAGRRGLTAHRRQVTLAAQDSYLFNATVERNAAYGLRLRGWDRARRREKALAALAAVGLEGFAGRRARQLSQGEGRRVALARALALEPRVLLLDEPFVNLDPESSQVFEKVISDLPAKGCDVIMVTHGLEQARRLAGRLVTLERGRPTAS